jgi:hypothetical protein
MSTLTEIRARSKLRDIFEGQLQHLGLAFLLAMGALSLLTTGDSSARILWLTAPQWATISIVLAIVHQVVVAAVFRLQLHRNLLSRWFGEADLGIWTKIFLPFLIARPITIALTGWADDVSLNEPRWAEWLVGAVMIGLAVWAMHSVLKYFTIKRAVGGGSLP